MPKKKSEAPRDRSHRIHDYEKYCCNFRMIGGEGKNAGKPIKTGKPITSALAGRAFKTVC